MRKFPIFIMSVIILIAIITFIFIASFYYSPTSNQVTESKFKQTWNSSTLGSLQVNENVIGYILNKLGAKDLHNPILSKDTPKIEVIVDDKIFNAEVEKGDIDVNKGVIENEDIKIIMTKQDVINIINSSSPTKSIENSINEGTMKFEIVASETKLVSKGYLSLYKKFSGKSIK